MGPLHGVTSLREKHRYNITPWARKLSDDDDSETEEDERLAVAAAMFSMAQRIKKGDCHIFYFKRQYANKISDVLQKLLSIINTIIILN